MVFPTTTLSQRARFTVFTLVQDWIFEENLALYNQSIENFNERVQLEVALTEREHEIHELRRRVESLEFTVTVIDSTNFDLRQEINLYREHVGRCLTCNEPLRNHYPRRVRRRLQFENEPVTQSSEDEEATEPEELPSDEDDAEL